MKKVVLYGELGRRFGKYHRFAVKTAAEAIRALGVNFPGFDSYMCNAHNSGLGFRVFVGHTSLSDAKETLDPAGDAAVIRLVPVIMGSKSPVFRIILGAALVGAGILLSPVTGGASLYILGGIGASMLIGGVSQLLTKPPDKNEIGYKEAEHKDSYIFDGPVNTSVQGATVPVVYGRHIVGSKVISAGIEAYEET